MSVRKGWKRRFTSAVLVGSAIAFAVPALAQEINVMGWARNFDHLKDGWNNTVEQFEKSSDGITVKTTDTAWGQTLQQATNAILAGNAPDVIQAPAVWVPQLQEIGGLMPMEDVFPDGGIENFPANESVTFDDKVRAAVWLPGPVLMVYNRKLMEEAGLDPDNPPKTFPEFTDAIKKICALPDRDGGKTYGIALRTARSPNSPQWALPVVFGHGGYITDPDDKVNVTNEGFVQAYEWFRDIIGSGCAADAATNNDTRNVFAQGRSGFIFEGPWARGLVKGISDGKLTVAPDGDVWAAPMPAGPDGEIRQIANHQTLVIPEGSTNKEAAAKFVRFALSDVPTVDFMFESSGNIPTGDLKLLAGSKVAEDPWSEVFISTLPYSTPVPIKHPKANAVFDALAPALQEIIAGADAQETLAKVQSDIDRLLSR